MKVDPVKMKSGRERRALTQESLAHKARVNVRTIQRAEGGFPIRAETLAEIAAVLGMPPAGLLRSRQEADVDPSPPTGEEGRSHVLKRVESGEVIISTLERSSMSVLECTAEPTVETMPHIRELITTLERLILYPWSIEDSPPLRFSSLLNRLDTIVELNGGLARIESSGLALFMATSTVFVRVPRMTDEGMVISHRQQPEYVTATRFLIAEYTAERIRQSADVLWPLELELDDDVPF